MVDEEKKGKPEEVPATKFRGKAQEAQKHVAKGSFVANERERKFIVKLTMRANRENPGFPVSEAEVKTRAVEWVRNTLGHLRNLLPPKIIINPNPGDEGESPLARWIHLLSTAASIPANLVRAGLVNEKWVGTILLDSSLTTVPVDVVVVSDIFLRIMERFLQKPWLSYQNRFVKASIIQYLEDSGIEPTKIAEAKSLSIVKIVPFVRNILEAGEFYSARS